jgi:hypothetical protein
MRTESGPVRCGARGGPTSSSMASHGHEPLPHRMIRRSRQYVNPVSWNWDDWDESTARMEVEGTVDRDESDSDSAAALERGVAFAWAWAWPWSGILVVEMERSGRWFRIVRSCGWY